MVWDLAIIAFVVTAAVADLRWRKIPRGLSLSGLIAGLGVHVHRGDITGSLAAALLGFAVGLALFSLGAIGGGDVKLITALGAMLALKPWAQAMYVAILTAALIAIAQIVCRRAVWQVLINLSELFRHFLDKGLKPHPVLNVNNPATIRSPFAVAAAIGTVFAVLAQNAGRVQFPH